MLYFSDWTPMLALDDSTLAALFRAAVRYAAEGEVPDFEGVSAILWGMIAPKIDRDGEAFAEKCRKARYSRYRGIEKSHDRAPLEYDEWIDLVDNRPSSTIVNRRDQLQSQSQLQKQSQLQPQPQTQGDEGGSWSFDDLFSPFSPGSYEPLEEDAFEEQREAQLAKLRSRS